jgi:hypothetical protein
MFNATNSDYIPQLFYTFKRLFYTFFNMKRRYFSMQVETVSCKLEQLFEKPVDQGADQLSGIFLGGAHCLFQKHQNEG